MTKIAILGHSHAVALLDALGEWRTMSGDVGSGELDDRYPASFQNWQSMKLGTQLFRLTARGDCPAFEDTLVSLLTPNLSGASELTRFVDVDKGILGITGLMTSIMDQIADRDVVISCLFGNEYVFYGMVDSIPLYDFAPYDGTPDAYPLDSRYVEAVLESFIQDTVVSTMFALKLRLPAVKIIHVLPPPPLEDPAAAPHWEALTELVTLSGFVRPSLRMKWYNSYVNAIRARLDPIGITCVTARADITTEAGFLRPEYASGLTHGNELYGQALARHLVEILDKADHAPL